MDGYRALQKDDLRQGRHWVCALGANTSSELLHDGNENKQNYRRALGICIRKPKKAGTHRINVSNWSNLKTRSKNSRTRTASIRKEQ